MTALAIYEPSGVATPPRDNLTIHADAQEDGLGVCFYQGRRYVFSFTERSLKRVRVGDLIVYADPWSHGLAVGELLALRGHEAMVAAPEARLPAGASNAQKPIAIVGAVIFDADGELN